MIFRVFFFALILISPVIIAQNLQIQSPVRFLALGDSYTIGESVPVNQRWPVQLLDSLTTRGIVTDTLRIIATTGWRTDNLLAAINNQNLQNQNYNLVSLLIGVNNQFQNRPFSQYITQFPQLLDSAIRYAGGDPSRVFVVSIPDYAYTPFGQQAPNPGAISQQIDQYNDFARATAIALGIKFFNITPISRQGINQPDLVASDGLHPSGVQYSAWVNLMLQHIDTTLTTSVPEVEIVKKSGMLLFPNPAQNHVYLQLSEKSEKPLLIRLYSASGKLQGPVIVLPEHNSHAACKLPLEGVAAGLYTILVQTENNFYSQSLIIK